MKIKGVGKVEQLFFLIVSFLPCNAHPSAVRANICCACDYMYALLACVLPARDVWYFYKYSRSSRWDFCFPLP